MFHVKHFVTKLLQNNEVIKCYENITNVTIKMLLGENVTEVLQF